MCEDDSSSNTRSTLQKQSKRWLNCFGGLLFNLSDGGTLKYIGEFGPNIGLSGHDQVAIPGAPGYFHGYGTYTFINSNDQLEKYVGQFYKGAMNGQGTMYFKDGSRYEGMVSNKEFNGAGKLFSPDGSIEKEGIWENGKLVQSKKIEIENILKGSPSLATNLIKRAVQGTVIEGSTEFTQDALQILAANNYDVESLKSPESVYRLTEAALAGGLVGQQIGVVTAPFTKESPVRTGAKDDFEMAQAFKAGQKAEQPVPEVAPEEKTKETSIIDFRNAQGRNIVDSIYDTQRSESSTRTDEQLSQDAADNAALDEEINILNEALNSGDPIKVSDANEILNKPKTFTQNDTLLAKIRSL